MPSHEDESSLEKGNDLCICPKLKYEKRPRSVIGIFCLTRRHLVFPLLSSSLVSSRGKKVIWLLLAAPAVTLLIHVFIDVLEMPRHNNNVTITRTKTIVDLTYIHLRTWTVFFFFSRLSVCIGNFLILILILSFHIHDETRVFACPILHESESVNHLPIR